MKNIVEHIFDIALGAIIVAFLIFMLYAGNANGHKGIFAALPDNGYKNVNDGVAQETNDEVKKALSTLPDTFTVKKINDVNKVAKTTTEDGTLQWQNLYKFRDLVVVLYDDKIYKFDTANKEWLVNDGSDFVKQANDKEKKNFQLYVTKITDADGKNVLLSDSVDSLGETVPQKVLYDEDTDDIAALVSGVYNFTVKITETNTKNVTEKTVSLPFTD